jgi:UDP-glucose:(heptosyl)LPS alpha-1,3-glucosyltransferase
VVSQSLADIPDGTVEWEPIRSFVGPAPLAYLGFFLQAGARVRGLTDAVIHSQGPNSPRFNVSSIHTVIRAKWNILRASQEFRRELTPRQLLSWNLHYWLASRMESRLYATPQGTLAPVSEGAAQELETIYRTPAGSIRVVHNGVDLDAFTVGTAAERQAVLRRLGLDPTKLYALFVGGEWARKGLPFAIEVIAACPSNLHLIVAGSGPVAHYQRYAVSCGVTDRVHFVGMVRDPASLYKTGLLLIMPSLYEAFSLVSLEAAASGLPLLTTAVNGTAELVVNGENGWVLQKDVSQWSDRVTALAEEPMLATDMGKRSREIVAAFTWDRAAATFEELYQEERSNR